MKKIFFISRLNIWYVGEKYQNKTAGNQTMYNTIKGYSDNGYKVLVLSSGVEKNLDLGLPNVTIKRSFYATFMQWKNQLFKTKVKEEKKEAKDFEVGKNHRPYSNMKTLKMWSFFATIEAFLLNLFFRTDVFYGYEFSGVVPAYNVAKIFNKPIVTRYQGTRLGFFLDNDEQFYACEDTIYAMRLPVDLTVIGDDGTQGDLVCEKLNISLNNVKLWMNGVDNLENIKLLKRNPSFRERYNIPSDAKIIGSSNRFDFWKRIDRLIDVFSSIARVNSNIYFVIVGDGPNRAYIENLAKEKGIYNRVIFCGALEHEKAVEVIRNSDIYMTMCDYTNLSNSVIEAQVMGVPVVTLDVGGIKKLIKNGENGYLFSTNELDRIPDVVNLLLTNKEEYNRISQNEIENAKIQILSWEDRMKKEVKAVEALL